MMVWDARPSYNSPARAQGVGHSVDDRGGVESQKDLLSVFSTLGTMAIVRLAFKLEDGVNYLDLARAMSITERRLIRQKQVFTVMGGHIADGNLNEVDGGDTSIKISTAPNNFYTRNAVTRGFRAWKAMRAKALEASGDGAQHIVTKYADFKVRLDVGALSYYRSPIDAGSQVIPPGEWAYSSIDTENPATPSQSLMIVGPHVPPTVYSLAQGWLGTRKALNRDPNMPDLDGDGLEDVETDLITTMFQDSTEDSIRLGKIETENDDQPFDKALLMTASNAYNSSEPRNLQLQYFCNLTNDDLNLSIPGFQALCGLVRVDVGNDYSNPILILDVETKGWSF
jgi:hypothetical protein